MILCKNNISVFKVCILCLALNCLCTSLKAQSNDSLRVDLNEVTITSIKPKQFNAVKKTQLFDSITAKNFLQQNLSDILSVNSPVFIKNYGPGNLSSAAFRGGNASQSPVLWNGFNIQNPMLGQNDFSQLPVFIFDKIGIEYGGSAATWGSGAMGGSIHLNNNNEFEKGFRTLLNLGLGSYGNKKLNSLLHFSNRKFSSNTKVYFNEAQNDFEFKDSTLKRQLHANYVIKGFLQEISWMLLKNQSINVKAWYHQSFRNLPPTLGNKTSKASQEDDNLKLTADWHYTGKSITPSVRVAYFNDQLNYTDSLAGIFSNSKTKTLIAEADAKYNLGKLHQIYLGYNFTNYNTQTNNYIQNNPELTKQAILLGYQLNMLNGKLVYELHLRKEFSDAFEIPFTGNTGLYFLAFKNLKLKLNTAKIYRLPTLNDLYWANGGNPDLKPEEGVTYEGGFEFKQQMNDFIFQSEMTYFNKTISNWIAWVPGPGGNPTPINLAKVYSRGTETSNFIAYNHKSLLCKIGFNSAYVLSNVIQSNLINDASVNKQLIYTPRYNYGGSFILAYEQFTLSYYHNYIGYRFTSSDNNSWLQPYQVANFKMSYTFKINHLNATTAIHINNVFNTDYTIIEQRPMPLRNYEFGLTLNYYKPKNKNNNSI